MTQEASKIYDTIVDEEMAESYISYAMSVIVSRALPDVRDGLKPVHRRILFAMNEMGLFHDKTFKKCARIVGEVLGKFHPHGDTAVYDALVRMAQDFSLRYPQIKGQGNFGNVDGDSAAAMRYTEAKLSKISGEMLQDLDKETVSFNPNFDNSLKEPSVLPCKTPNLLINGSSGIAVGMATNIPPHNLNEVCDGVIYLIDNPDASVNDLMQFVKGPDFPTGGILLSGEGIKNMYLTGKGRAIVRSKTHTETIKNRNCIIVDEIPFQVNKSQLLEAIADCVKDKKITGIADIRDESDRDGMRVVFILKQDANSDVVLNQLFKHSRLQVSFSSNMLALVNSEPKTLGLKPMMENFLSHRQVIVRKRIEFELDKAQKRVHILEGLLIALKNIDEAIRIIKSSGSVKDASIALITRFELSELQSQAILEMRLSKLTSLEQDKIKAEHSELQLKIAEYKEILASELKILNIIKEELLDMKEKYGDNRRTEIVHDASDTDINYEDLISDEPVVVTMTQSGYMKRQNIDTYKAQKRGGKGIIGTSKNEEDIVHSMFIATNHSYVLLFTDNGQVHWLKIYQIPEGSRQAKGTAVVNLLNLPQGEKVTAIVPVRDFEGKNFIVMATKKGVVKKVKLEEFSRPRKGGIRAITLEDTDVLISVVVTNGEKELLFASRNGRAVRCSENDVRAIGRAGKGVNAMTLNNGDFLVSMILGDMPNVLTITDNGFGKKSPVEDYRMISRGGKGVINIQCSDRNGCVASVMSVNDEDDILLISKQGIIIRTEVKQIPTIGRNTQGVRIMKLGVDDLVVSATKFYSLDEP